LKSIYGEAFCAIARSSGNRFHRSAKAVAVPLKFTAAIEIKAVVTNDVACTILES